MKKRINQPGKWWNPTNFERKGINKGAEEEQKRFMEFVENFGLTNWKHLI